MSTTFEKLRENSKQIAKVDLSEEAQNSVLLEDTEGKRYLLWKGPASWMTQVEVLLNCGELPAIGEPVHRPDGSVPTILLECSTAGAEPFDVWKWRNLPAHRCISALQNLARTLRTIHDGGFALHGIRRSELLLDHKTGHLTLAAMPRLRAHDDDSETVWRDIRLFTELAYENFLDHEYPGGHQLVALLQDRAAMAETGITMPGLSQLLAGCVTPYGDLAYHSIDELLLGLDHLSIELATPINYRVGSRSTQGNHIFRQNNQDSCGHVMVDTICGSKRVRMGFFCVADGIGGIDDGERASSLAVQSACSSFLRAWNHCDGEDIYKAPVAFARAIAQITSQRLALEGDFSPKTNRGGTTFTGLLLAGDRAGICHVGDSRAVLIRDSQVIELTRDHTLATILRKLGEDISDDEDSASHRTISRFFSTGAELEWSRIASFVEELPQKLGMSAEDLYIRGLQLQPGDIIVLTTDGTHEEVGADELMRLLSLHQGDPQKFCNAVVDRALEKVGRDNATALVVLVE